MSTREDTIPLTISQVRDGDTPPPVPHSSPPEESPSAGLKDVPAVIKSTPILHNKPDDNDGPTINNIQDDIAEPSTVQELVSCATNDSFSTAIGEWDISDMEDRITPPNVQPSSADDIRMENEPNTLDTSNREEIPKEKKPCNTVEKKQDKKGVKWGNGSLEIEKNAPEDGSASIEDDPSSLPTPTFVVNTGTPQPSRANPSSSHVRLSLPRHSIFDFHQSSGTSDDATSTPHPVLSFLVDPYNTTQATPVDIELQEMAPPPAEELNLPGRLTFVDFTPKCTREGGILTSPSFEGFDVLVHRANVWLRRHPTLRPQLLETVDYRLAVQDIKYGRSVDSKVATICDRAPSGSMTINILRMWVIQRTPSEVGGTTEIGYLNVVPACLDPGGIFRRPLFDTLETTIDKFNEMLKQRPLPGRVFNLETFQMRFRQYGKWVDPKRCHWQEHNDISASSLTVIRLYYRIGAPFMEHIAFKDIVPGTYQALWGSVYRLQFENFNGLPSRINNWLRNRTSVSILNIHTVNHKIKDLTSGQCLDTQKSLTTSYRTPNQLQVVRIWYIQLGGVDIDMTPPASPVRSRHTSPVMVHQENTSLRLNPSPSPKNRRRRSTLRIETNTSSDEPSGRVISSCVTCKTFVPQPVGKLSMFETPSFETLSHTRKRMEEWLSYNPGIRILSADTSCVLLDSSIEGDQCLPLYYPRGATAGSLCWLQVLRVYYEGHSHEIPAAAVQYNNDSDQSLSATSNKKHCNLM